MAGIKNFIAAIVLLALIAGVGFAQERRQTDLDFLLTKSDRFDNYSEDFLALSKSAKGEDWNAPNALFSTATAVQDYVFAALSLLTIYENLSCQSDRAMAWAVLKSRLDYYARQIDHHIEAVNIRLSQVRIPAVAASGTQMKEDMRGLKMFFESIRPKPEGDK